MSARADASLPAVRRAVRAALSDLGPGGRPLVAMSGGPDSLALAAAVSAEAAAAGWLPATAVVDHGLQPGSASMAATAVAAARALGLDPVDLVRVTVASGPGAGGPEAAARAARREALLDVAARTGAAPILLGHTRDDQAETVLLGLLRGSGPRSLAGMAAVAGPWRRPLLDLPRELVRRAAAETGLPVVADPHNDDPTFRRVVVRHQVMPMLADRLGPGIAAGLVRTAALCRADADALDAWTDVVMQQVVRPEAAGAATVDVVALGEQPVAVRSRVLRRVVLAAGAPASALTRDHVLAVDRFAAATAGRGAPALPGGVAVERRCGRLWIGRPGAAGHDPSDDRSAR